MNKVEFGSLIKPDGIIRGPFGSDMKKSLFVDYSKENIKVITQQNVFDENVDEGDYFITPDYFKKMSRFEIYEGDFLITCDGTLGRIMHVDKLSSKSVINSSLLIIRLDEKKIYPRYFYYLWKYKLCDAITKRNVNSCLKHLPSLDVIKKEMIDLPDFNTQKRFSIFLDNFRDKIILNRNIERTLYERMRTIYSYYFNQFNYPNECGKPYSDSNGTFKMVNEHQIPSKWEYKSIKDLCKITTGKFDANHNVENGKYKFFTCSEEEFFCDTCTYDCKAVLIAGNGTLNVKMYQGKFDAYQRTYVIEPNNEELFSLIYVICENEIDSLRAKSNGSIIKFITLGMIENIFIPIPDDLSILEEMNISADTILNLRLENEKMMQMLDYFSLQLLSDSNVVLAD